jgi:FkbM family methyltransferase
LDIGANIGATSLLLGQIAKSVVSFEAAPSTFRFLEQNVKASNLANVTLVNVGLGSKRQVMQITIAPSNRSGAYISNKTEASAGHIQENVQIETLDGFLEAGAHVDFIKLDVEGFELEVLKGANEVLRSSRPTVMLEMNHWCLNAFQRISLPEFIEFLTDLFPIVVAVEGDTYLDLRDPGQRYIVMYKHIVEGFKYIDVVCSFEESRIAAFRQAFSHAS